MKNDDTNVKKEDEAQDLEEIVKKQKEVVAESKQEKEDASSGTAGLAQSKKDKAVEAFKEQVVDLEGKYKRALADYQNLQRRAQEDRLHWMQSANQDLLLRLLPVLDTLMLASKHIQDQGLTVSINQFLDTLKTEGVTKVETVGNDFDPQVMEAIAVEEGADGKVLEEMRAGYLLHDKLLRAAQVKVGKK